MCTAYAVRQHRLSVLVKVFSRSRARTGAAGSARSRPERSAAPAASTRSGARRGRSLLAPARSGAPVVSDLRSVRREVVFRAQTHRDAPRDHAGSMCHTTDVPRLPRRVLRPTQHAARAEPAERDAGSAYLCRSPYRHARGVVAGRESCYESIPTIAKNLRIRDGIS